MSYTVTLSGNNNYTISLAPVNYSVSIAQLASSEIDTKVAAAQTAQTGAETAETNAETAETNAEAARDLSLAYRDSAAVSAALAAAEAAGITGYDLSAIADTIAATAVDVFVYDTTQDSDGGAWRNRCQHTSWYNETLNTATRGARQEFPVKALIVAEAAKVTIYDLDDPAVPMWMVFNSATGNILRGTSTIKSLSARNGTLVITGVTGATSVNTHVVHILKDAVDSYNTNRYLFNGSISQRNENLDITLVGTTGAGLVNATGNDIAITTLPGAPIDDQTGLPVPTRFVATDGGWSQINEDGTVYDFAFSSYPKVTSIHFDKERQVVCWQGASNAFTFDRGYFEHPLLTEDTVGQAYASFAGSTFAQFGTSTEWPQPSKSSNDLASHSLPGVMGGSAGLYLTADLYEKRNTAITSDGMLAEITADYATGWQHGDIRGTFLCEASEDDLVGGELVTNGDFSTSDLSAWTVNANVTASVVGGRLQVVNASGSQQDYILEGISTSVSSYVVQVSEVTDATVFFDQSGGSTVEAPNGSTNFSATYTSANTNPTKIIVRVANGATAYVDGLSWRLANEDRSVNANGLAVNGTITVAPVETGAETMAYSGFSATNYLSQPYNSALDFGTGDFYVMGWVGVDLSNVGTILQRGTTVNTNEMVIYYDTSGNLVVRVLDTSSAISATGVLTAGWHKVAILRSNGILSAYVDGNLVSSVSNTQSATYATSPLYFGRWITNGSISNSGSLSRLRIGAGAPTPEQIKKIYRDELPLYREDAACTLNGTSSAVTAMSSDPVTGLLQVGTSGGLSAFRGLQRVEQDTTAVTTTISANGATVARQ